MTEVQRIQDQLRRALEGGAWHGPAVHELVTDLSADEAGRRPLGVAHTPWEIVLHLTTWLDAVRRRLGGEDYNPSDEANWPSVSRPSGAAWAQARERLAAAGDALLESLDAWSPDDLDRPVAGQEYSTYFMLHGAVQHTVYHAGQLAILKKAIRAGSS